MKILITAFDPFGGEPINPALEAVKAMKDEIAGARLIKLEIPTVFADSADYVLEAMTNQQPDIVLCIGQAGGRYGICPERVAINLIDARIPDNQGEQPIDEPIFPDGKNAYFSSLPVKAMAEAIKAKGLPASVSNTAGTFVCNYIMYCVLYYIEKKFPDMKGGFIHVPYIPAQVTTKPNTPAMSVSDITTALESAVEAIIANAEDLRIIGGETH